MNLKNNTVWIVRGKDSFAVFTSKEYAQEHKNSIIEAWKKSIIRNTIPERLKNRKEIEKHCKNYPHVIQVDKDHYELVSSTSSGPNGYSSMWYYRLISNADWDEYLEDFENKILIKDYVILR